MTIAAPSNTVMSQSLLSTLAGTNPTHGILGFGHFALIGSTIALLIEKPNVKVAPFSTNVSRSSKQIELVLALYEMGLLNLTTQNFPL